MKLSKTESVLSPFFMMQNNITIIKTNTINIITIKKSAPKVYNLKPLKFSPAKSILLQFLSLNTKLLKNKFLIQKTGDREVLLIRNG